MMPDYDEIRTSKMPIYASAIMVRETKTPVARTTLARAFQRLQLLLRQAAAQNRPEMLAMTARLRALAGAREKTFTQRIDRSFDWIKFR